MRQAVRRSVFLGKVWLLTLAIRLALWVVPFASVQRFARRLARRAPPQVCERRRRPAALAWAVRRVTRYVPRASCLTQALATQVLLSRAGYLPNLRIGLTQDPEGDLQAHAWVENLGEVVIGGGGLDRFKPLPAVEKT